MLRTRITPFDESQSCMNEYGFDRNNKAKSLQVDKNINFGDEDGDWLKPGKKCFHSSIGSISSYSQVDQLDDNVFKTPTNKSPPSNVFIAEGPPRKVFFDISNKTASHMVNKIRPNNIDHRVYLQFQSKIMPNKNKNNPDFNKIFTFFDNHSNHGDRKTCQPENSKQVARLKRIWRYRLGSSGDRTTSSPPHISHKDIKSIKLKKLIGRGGFGTVYLGVFKDKIVAVKRLHRRVKNARAKLESFRAECNILNFKHPNIVQVLAASIGDPTQEAVIVMEFAGDYNLLSVINDSNQILDFPKRVKYSLEITTALQFIHSNRVVHLDLKPANVIITSKDECKLGDFGCCRLLRPHHSDTRDGNSASSVTDDKASPSPLNDSDFCLFQGRPQAATQLAGTFVYRAPELLKGEPPGPRSDVFSLGVTMWQMLSRVTPYAGKDKHAIIFGVVAYDLRPSFEFNDNSEFDSTDTHYLLSLPRSKCFDNRQQCNVSSAQSYVEMSRNDFPLGEKRYRETVERCWMGNQSSRPWPHELIETFQMWQSEFV